MRSMSQMCALSSHTDHLHTCDVNFGVASHFKNLADGSQAHLRSALSECAKSTEIHDIPGMIASCSALYTAYQSDTSKSPRMQATFHDFIPLQPKHQFEAEKSGPSAPNLLSSRCMFRIVGNSDCMTFAAGSTAPTATGQAMSPPYIFDAA